MAAEGEEEDWTEAWYEDVEGCCERLRQSDASTKKVFVNSDYALQICRALRGNTVVEYLGANFLWIPRSAMGELNRYIMTSPSLKEFDLGSANGSDSLEGMYAERLPLANLMLFSTCASPNPIETLVGVPLCQSTALTFCNALRINHKLRNLSIDFPFEHSEGSGSLEEEEDDDEEEEEEDEEEEDDNDPDREGADMDEEGADMDEEGAGMDEEGADMDEEGGGDLAEDGENDPMEGGDDDEPNAMNDLVLVRNSLASEVAQALSLSSVQSLSLNWLEHANFPVGKAFFEALPGYLPGSLRQLELNNFCNSSAIGRAISEMIMQSEPQLDSIFLAFCRFSDGNFRRILRALQHSKPNLKILHYGFLHEGTAPLLGESIGSFTGLIELGVGFHRSMEAFEVFCQELPRNETIKTLDVQVFGLYMGERLDRFLRGLATIIPKLPSLCSITSNYTYSNSLAVKNPPVEFLAAVEAHERLENFLPQISFADKQVEYYLRRNRFRDRLAATKPVMVQALHDLNDDDPISCTLVKDTLISRSDWLLPGVDQGKPLPPAATELPTFRRFQPGLLF